ncbi:MAG TPA: DNA polymerase III subunit gamma/tau [Cyanobacteria bacterium UBA8803]|nr:DNA polymerase III subunit gamma/tau [Cyanobacteria bacterium UBA9273]HBL61407.1 DNA polymerase III subunit gamma/tau [Cyanobacteria bacterium UBA8803]
MSYEPLHHKYRPQTFADLVGQEAIATTLTNAILSQRIAPAYLFTGSRGTGKTSSARILAKSLNCLQADKPTPSPCGVCEVCQTIASGQAIDVMEIDAASNTGVDNIRDLIEKAQFAPVQCRYKVYAIDECHMLSVAAFNALLKTLEEPPKHVVFILATTDPQRVLPTIISRCQRFDFRRIPLEAMVSHLKDIAAKENINITPDAITLVAQVAQGGLRDAESLLDQLGLLPKQVTAEEVWDLVGAVPERDLLALAQAIASDNCEAVLDYCRLLTDRGREPLVVLQNLAGFYRDLLIAKTAPNRQDLVAVTPPTWEQLRQFAQTVEVPYILQSQQHLKNSEVQIKNTTQPRLWLEIAVLSLLPSANRLQQREPEPSKSEFSVSSWGTNQTPKSTQPPAVPDTSRMAASPTPNPIPTHGTPIQQPPPAPTPPASEPAVSVSATTENDVDAQALGLEQVWQKILNYIKLFGTKQLLQQKCSLLAFTGQQATVGVSSKGLLAIAQTKLPDIEAAFAAAYQSQIKVHLQVGTSRSDSNQPASSTLTVEPTPPETVRPPLMNESPRPDTRAAVSEIAKRENEEPPSPRSDNRINAISDRPTVVPLATPSSIEFVNEAQRQPPSPVPLSVPELDWDTDEIEKANNALIKEFGGEMITLTDGASQPESKFTEPTQFQERMDRIKQHPTEISSPAVVAGRLPHESFGEEDLHLNRERIYPNYVPAESGPEDEDEDLPF